MQVGERKVRKVRSDKKRDVKPTISVSLKNCLYSLSYVTSTPVKDVAVLICEKGWQSRKVIEFLAHHFRRDYQFSKTLFIGDWDVESLQRKYQSPFNERITLRFTQGQYEHICRLAHALDVTPSKATALLLDASVHNTNIVNAVVKLHLHGQVDQGRMKELKNILRYINEHNPYEEEVSWFAFLAMIVDEMKEGTQNMKDTLQRWVMRYR